MLGLPLVDTDLQYFEETIDDQVMFLSFDQVALLQNYYQILTCLIAQEDNFVDSLDAPVNCFAYSAIQSC